MTDTYPRIAQSPMPRHPGEPELPPGSPTEVPTPPPGPTVPVPPGGPEIIPNPSPTPITPPPPPQMIRRE